MSVIPRRNTPVMRRSARGESGERGVEVVHPAPHLTCPFSTFRASGTVYTAIDVSTGYEVRGIICAKPLPLNTIKLQQQSRLIPFLFP